MHRTLPCIHAHVNEWGVCLSSLISDCSHALMSSQSQSLWNTSSVIAIVNTLAI